MERLAVLMVSAVALLGLVVAAEAQRSPQERGRAIAESKCARCHAIGESGVSPLGLAPPFRELHLRYPIASLAEALAEGIITGHSMMPRFTFNPDEINALLTYLESLQQ
jgi:cytochrome c